MSGNVDNRVVAMKFDNKQFEQGVAQSMGTLDKLKQNLKLTDATRGMDDLSKAAGRFSLKNLSDAPDGISAKFVALSAVAITAIANITNRAVDAGITIAKSFTLDPIKAGFDEYELKMGSIQTILANTSKFGTKLPQVTAALDELNEYSDKTIYNFGDMVKNVGLFTNAGLKLEESTAIIKGFSNEAAVSGVTAANAAGAAYQLSQALSAGVVKLIDFKSLTNVGLGNANMKSGIIDIASAMGTFNKDTTTAKAAAKDFNGSLEKGWLSAKVMTNYLKIQAGELSVAQMRNIGLTDAQIKKFQKQQKTAEEAATKVRTFTQLIGVIKESIGSGWSETFGILIGDFESATNLWTSVNNILGPIINGFSDARNKLLGDWADLGGREVLIEGIGNAFKALFALLKPIKDAFREIFPPATGQQLFNLTERFRDFTKSLIAGGPLVDGIKGVFKVLFTVLKIGIGLIKGIFTVMGLVWGTIFRGIGAVGQLAGGTGGLIDKFNEWLDAGNKLQKFFSTFTDTIQNFLGPVGESLEQVAIGFKELVTGDTDAFIARMELAWYALGPAIDKVRSAVSSLGEGFSNALEQVSSFIRAAGGAAFAPVANLIDNLVGKIDALREKVGGLKDVFSFKPEIDTSGISKASGDVAGLSSAGEKTQSIWQGIVQAFSKAKEVVGPALAAIGELLGSLGRKLIDWIKNLEFQEALALLNTFFFIALYRMLKQFLGSIDKLVTSVSGVFNQLTDTLKTMQQDVKANIILKIAIAVALLTASLVALSRLDPKDIAIGIGAIGLMITMLVKAMGKFAEMDVSANAKMLTTAASMLILTASILILAQAVETLGQMDMKSLAKGLAAVGIILAGLGLFAKFALVNAGGASAGLGLMLMAVAINILAGAVAILGNMKTETLKKGLTVILAIMTGMAALAAVFGLIGPGVLAASVAMVIMAGALTILSGVILLYAAIDGKTLSGGLIAIGLALLVLAGGMYAMQGGLAGAAAMLIAAGAIVLLAGAIKVLGEMTDRNIVRAIGTLLALTGILAILGVTAIFISAPLLLLSVAILAMGAAMMLAGVGMFLFATGFAILAAAGTAGAAVLLTAFQAFAAMIPLFMQQIGLGIVALAVVIRDAGPVLVGAISTLLQSMLQAIINNIPKFAETLSKLISAGLALIRTKVPEFVETGWSILKAFIGGIRNNLPKVVKMAGDIIVDFINGISNNIQRIITAGTNLVIDFIKGIAKAGYRIITAAGETLIQFLNGLTAWINANSGRLNAAGWDLAVAIINGMKNGIGQGPSMLFDAVKNMASSVIDGIKGWFGINSPSKVTTQLGKYVAQGFAKGLGGSKADINNAMKTLLGQMKDGLKKVNDGLKTERDKLKDLQNNPRTAKNDKAIDKQLVKIKALEKEKKNLLKAQNLLKVSYKDEQKLLGQLADKEAANAKKLATARQKLADLKTDKANKAKEIADQYRSSVDITKNTTVAGFLSTMKVQTDAVAKFKATLDSLRKLGLDNASYEKLLAEGPEAQNFANQLLEGGKGSVGDFNKANAAMAAQAKALGDKAASELYDAGIRSAQGLVDGLAKEEKKIQAAMDKIAAKMVKGIKKALGIKSPSRVFAGIGRFSALGLVSGLKKYAKHVGKASTALGETAADRVKTALQRVSDVAMGDIDASPVIAPVIDLKRFKREADRMKGYMPDGTLAADFSSAAAGTLSAQDADRRLAKIVEQWQAAEAVGSSVTFNQTNNSPVALTTTEIYRQTKNQLSLVDV